MKGKFIFVLGGTRSGKSEFAEKIAGSLGDPVTYIATAAVIDEEMAKRVSLHKERRPPSWRTVEEQKDILAVISKGVPGETFLLDCVTVWVSNLLFDESGLLAGDSPYISFQKEAFIVEQARLLAQAVRRGVNLVAVAGEVGLGIVPAEPGGRVFRDVAGRVNQVLASFADRVYFVIAGIPLAVKPSEKSFQQLFLSKRRRLRRRGVLFY